ncbi:hypothetical protein [Solibacillus daqui]|uniref:hypothetical protein n=1 Tax=Solibacillus daqui TaxID=2912187 RepID=UPI00236655D9|nr:hypothetical protein [Solibacillus daqui]
MAGQVKLNRYQLDKVLKKYRNNMCKYKRMKDQLGSFSATAHTTTYGIEFPAC